MLLGMLSMEWQTFSKRSRTRKAKPFSSQKLILLTELIYTDEKGGTQTVSLWKNISNGRISLSCSRPPRNLPTSALTRTLLQYSGTECQGTKRSWTYCVEWDGMCRTSPLFGIKVKLDRPQVRIPPLEVAMNLSSSPGKDSLSWQDLAVEMISTYQAYKRGRTPRRSRCGS